MVNSTGSPRGSPIVSLFALACGCVDVFTVFAVFGEKTRTTKETSPSPVSGIDDDEHGGPTAP